MPQPTITHDDEALRLVHRCLLDAIACADDLVSGSRDGFKIEAICEALEKIADHGASVFAQCSRSYPIGNDPFEYDGIAGASWHEVASEWMHRLLNHIAIMTDRDVIGAPNQDGTFRVQLLPPILSAQELSNIRIAYTSPRRLEAKLRAEISLVMDQKQEGSGQANKAPLPQEQRFRELAETMPNQGGRLARYLATVGASAVRLDELVDATDPRGGTGIFMGTRSPGRESIKRAVRSMNSITRKTGVLWVTDGNEVKKKIVNP